MERELSYSKKPTKKILCILEAEHSIPMVMEDKKFIGNWNEIHWEILVSICSAIQKLAADTFNISEDAVRSETYEQMGEQFARYGAEVYVMDGNWEINMEIFGLFEKEVAAFIESISWGNVVLKNYDISESLDDQSISRLKKHSEDFLSAMGGRQIRNPIKLSTPNSTINCNGKFSRRPASNLAKPCIKMISGKFDGFKISKRELFVVESKTGNALQIFFDIEKHLEKILKLNPITNYQFTVSQQSDAGGKCTLTFAMAEVAEVEGDMLI